MIIIEATESHAQTLFDLDDYVLRDPKDMDILKDWIHNKHVFILLGEPALMMVSRGLDFEGNPIEETVTVCDPCDPCDETVIGYTALGMSPNTDEEHRGYIFSIAVRRDSRRNGHGTRLLAHAIETLQTLGAGVVDLDVRRSNAPAIALYEEFGFKKYGMRPKLYDDGEDALVYLKTL